jgi:hypothetical protein
MSFFSAANYIDEGDGKDVTDGICKTNGGTAAHWQGQ